MYVSGCKTLRKSHDTKKSLGTGKLIKQKEIYLSIKFLYIPRPLFLLEEYHCTIHF